jgi:hypothetical protein
VTAQRRSENLEKVAVAVSVLRSARFRVMDPPNFR